MSNIPRSYHLFQVSINIQLNKGALFRKCCQYFQKHQPTWEEFSDILNLVNFVASTNVVPNTKFKFMREFSDSKSKPLYHMECPECHGCGTTYDPTMPKPIDFDCINCKKHVSMSDAVLKFITFDVNSQIRELIKRNSSILVYPNETSDNFPIKDIIHSAHHRLVAAKMGNFISVLFNTDGVAIHKKSKYSMWPLMFAINNLPKNIRYKRENLPIAGLYFGNNIDLQDYVSKFVNEIDRTNETGPIETPVGNLPVRCISASLDAPARAKLSNMKGPTGYDSCKDCLIHGETILGTVRFCYS